jgi:uncharacterized protein (DUF433 family)
MSTSRPLRCSVIHPRNLFAGKTLFANPCGITYNFYMSNVATCNPNVLGGTPVFAGTRVPVESLFDYLSRGRTIDYFLEQFPTVLREQVETLLDEAKTKALSREASV